MCAATHLFFLSFGEGGGAIDAPRATASHTHTHAHAHALPRTRPDLGPRPRHTRGATMETQLTYDNPCALHPLSRGGRDPAGHHHHHSLPRPPPPPSTQQAKHLGLRFKERYTTRDGLHARVTGVLDTVTGGFAYAARLEKVVGPPLPPAGAPWAAKREALARPRAAVGLAYCSRRDAVLARVAAGGAADLGGEAWLSGKAVAEVDTRTQKVSVCV